VKKNQTRLECFWRWHTK